MLISKNKLAYNNRYRRRITGLKLWEPNRESSNLSMYIPFFEVKIWFSCGNMRCVEVRWSLLAMLAGLYSILAHQAILGLRSSQKLSWGFVQLVRLLLRSPFWHLPLRIWLWHNLQAVSRLMRWFPMMCRKALLLLALDRWMSRHTCRAGSQGIRRKLWFHHIISLRLHQERRRNLRSKEKRELRPWKSAE